MSCSVDRQLTFTPVITECNCSDWPNWTDRDDVTCHYISVPEDHGNPDGKVIRLAFAHFRHTGTGDAGIPILYLTGGPGGRSLNSPARWERSALREIGDLIIVEQRGIGLSSPLPGVGQRTFEILAADLTAKEERAQTEILLQENARDLREAGIDVTKYNSTQNALDFGLLMDGLGHDQYRLYGSSYGTRLAAGIMREFADKVQAAVLNGPANLDGKALEGRFPNLIRAFNKLYTACASDPECDAAYPDLRQTFLDGLAGLAEEAMVVDVDGVDYAINPQDAVYLIRYLLYRSTGFQTAPQFMQAIHDRDIARVQELVQAPMQFIRSPGITVFYAFQAYEEWSEDTPENVTAVMQSAPELQYGVAWFQAFIPHLGSWSTARASEEEQTFQDIEVPALVIVNEFDPVTPPHHTKMFESAIRDCQVIRLNQFGHGSGSDCLDRITQMFFMNPEREIDRDCLK